MPRPFVPHKSGVHRAACKPFKATNHRPASSHLQASRCSEPYYVKGGVSLTPYPSLATAVVYGGYSRGVEN